MYKRQLLNYADGEKRYIIAPKGLTVGTTVVSGKGADIKVGNALELKDIDVYKRQDGWCYPCSCCI